jgi:hypothetical protein
LFSFLSSVSVTIEAVTVIATVAVIVKTVIIAVAVVLLSSMSIPCCSVCVCTFSGLLDVIIQTLLYIKKTSYIVKFIKLETK